jgi:hypothetical protein
VSAPASPFGFPLVDADEHYYEPRDAFTRHMPKALKRLAIRVEGDPASHDGERIVVGDKPFTFLRANYDRVVRPGALREMLRTMKSGLRPARPSRKMSSLPTSTVMRVWR